MKILIGSNGGLTGVYLAKRYRLIDGITVFGADASANSVGRFFVEKQYKLPAVTDVKFIDSLIMLLNRKRIDIYIPTHSKETLVVAHYEKEIRKRTSARFLISPKETYDDLDNKAKANEKLVEIGIPVPNIITGFDCNYPIIMKKNIGSGSNGTLVIQNEKVHRAYKESTNNVSFYRMVNGSEYTVDCMFDTEGKLLGFNQRRRLKTNGGAVSITANCSDFDILPWIKKITKKWQFCGCVNFQYIVDNKIPYFIDINLRYPAGGLPLSVESGLDIPRMVINILKGKTVEFFTIPNEKKQLSMYRYYEEIFE